MCRKFFWIKFEKKIRDRKSIDSQSLLSGLLPYFAQNPFNSIKFENFLCGLISARYKMCYSSSQEDAIILITNYHAKNTPKIW